MLLNGGRVTLKTMYRMTVPFPAWTVMPLALASDAYSVGVKVWNAMSISPRWSASFMVEDFEK